MRTPSRVISIEETCWTPGFRDAFPAELSNTYAQYTKGRLDDVGEARIARMDAAGIDLQVLSIVTPGAQVFAAEQAVGLSRESNDWMAEITRRYPTRFAAFAAVPTPDPAIAVDELTRAVEVLGMKGGLINGHTHGAYLDDERFDPLLARFAKLDVPLYIHPANIPKPVNDTYFGTYPELALAPWGWTIDTATHVLRLMASGAFDRHPTLKVIIGHMGELIPFHLKRIDKASQWGSKMQRTPSDYMRDNVFITTGAVFQTPALVCAVMAVGIDNVLFSIDDPFEDNFEATAWLKTVPLSDADQEKLAHGNSERLLKL